MRLFVVEGVEGEGRDEKAKKGAKQKAEAQVQK